MQRHVACGWILLVYDALLLLLVYFRYISNRSMAWIVRDVPLHLRVMRRLLSTHYF